MRDYNANDSLTPHPGFFSLPLRSLTRGIRIDFKIHRKSGSEGIRNFEKKKNRKREPSQGTLQDILTADVFHLMHSEINNNKQRKARHTRNESLSNRFLHREVFILLQPSCRCLLRISFFALSTVSFFFYEKTTKSSWMCDGEGRGQSRRQRKK